MGKCAGTRRLAIRRSIVSRPSPARAELARRIEALQTMDRRLHGPIDEDVTNRIRYESEIRQMSFHAKGGLGAVFVGEDHHLSRRVAVKFIHRNLARDPDSRRQFELEAEITGRLEHPGVIPLYGLGQSQDGRQFYTMRFIDGHTLDEAIRRFHTHQTGELGVAFHDLLHRFVSVCKTIAYAHNRGIVHRDIKPDNVMLGRYGETIVVDWGLACPVARDERLRQSGEQTLLPKAAGSGSSSGQGAGTPAYMSPEQASELAPTPSSDIYSLGATLYKILTGRPPVGGESLVEIKTRIIEGRVPKPSSMQKEVARPLEAICQRAMALRPQDRYATALELAHDVERYLADEAVEAYVEPLNLRLGRWLRRNRNAAITAFAGLSCCLLLAALTSFWLAHAAKRESVARRDAERAQDLAESSRRENLGTSAMFLAKSLAQEIDLRWRILEAEAASPRLREVLSSINEGLLDDTSTNTADFAPLQSWLEKRYIANQSAARNVCWCINAIDGTQVARAPEAPSIGQNFKHRDYFHGEGHDLSPQEVAERQTVRPLADRIVYISAVFQSTNTRTLMVTFSVPIWSGPPEDQGRERIGILAMPVELGDFGLGSHAILADTRRDQLHQRAGLILHHPRLGLRSENDELPYLSQLDLERADSLRQDRRLVERLSPFGDANVFEDFRDPLSGDSRLAAFEPVIVPGRKRETADTGWVVIATEDD